MKQKKIIFSIFLLATIIFLLNNVSAVYQCWVETGTSPSAAAGACTSSTLDGVAGQVLMFLSGSSNAHGALSNQNSYNSVLCCNFGSGGTTCVNTPYKTNKLIGLSASTNAHAESPSWANPNYLNNVCYDSFDACYSVPSSLSCGTNTEILRLSSVDTPNVPATNSHIAEAGTANYPTEICCLVNPPTSSPTSPVTVCGASSCSNPTPICDQSTTTCVPCDATHSCLSGQTCNAGSCENSCVLTDVYWSFNGIDKLTDANQNGIGDSSAVGGQQSPIKLVVQGTNCDGKTVSFTVKEKTLSGTTTLTTQISATFIGGYAIGSWTPEYQAGIVDQNQFEFAATVSGVGTLNSETNSPLLQVIQKPVTDPCTDVSQCSDYSSTQCTSTRGDNNDICGVAANSVGTADCSNPSVRCYCVWNSGSCLGAYVSAPVFAHGDGEISRGETCDTSNFNNLGCANFDSFTGGTLSCISSGANIGHVDTSQCIGGISGVCGDNKVNAGEECDGSQASGGWGHITGCSDFGFSGGTLSCDSSCTFDTTQCTGGYIPPVTSQSPECKVTTTKDSNGCADGSLTYSWTAVWSGDESSKPESCKGGGPITKQCPAQVELPLFNTYTFFITLALIAMIYALMKIKRRE